MLAYLILTISFFQVLEMSRCCRIMYIENLAFGVLHLGWSKGLQVLPAHTIFFHGGQPE